MKEEGAVSGTAASGLLVLLVAVPSGRESYFTGPAPWAGARTIESKGRGNGAREWCVRSSRSVGWWVGVRADADRTFFGSVPWADERREKSL